MLWYRRHFFENFWFSILASRVPVGTSGDKAGRRGTMKFRYISHVIRISGFLFIKKARLSTLQHMNPNLQYRKWWKLIKSASSQTFFFGKSPCLLSLPYGHLELQDPSNSNLCIGKSSELYRIAMQSVPPTLKKIANFDFVFAPLCPPRPLQMKPVGAPQKPSKTAFRTTKLWLMCSGSIRDKREAITGIEPVIVRTKYAVVWTRFSQNSCYFIGLFCA